MAPLPPPREREPLAIAALVVSLATGALISLGLGIAALVKIRRHNRRGTGMAITAIVFSVLGTVLWSLVGLGVWLVHDKVQEYQDNNAVLAPEVGDCLPTISEGAAILKKVDCTVAHTAEVFAVFDLPDGPFDATTIEDGANEGCGEKLPDSFVGVKDEDLEMYYFGPLELGWQRGDRQVICILKARTRPLTASVLP